MKSLIKKLLLIITVPVILWGCAAPKLPDIIWPAAPDIPRIKYVQSFYSGGDVKQSSLLSDIVMGADEGNMIKKPMGIFVDNSGKIFLTDTAASDILILDPIRHTSTYLSTFGVGNMSKPISVATDGQGRLFFTDSLTNRVQVIGKDGHFLTDLKADVPFNMPSGLAIDKQFKRIYVSDTRNHCIKEFDLDTLKYLKTIGSRGGDDGQFNYPSHIAVDSKGYLYVADTQNGRYQVFDTEGKFVRKVGQFGDAPGMFGRPKGIGVDSEGHVYVADAAFNLVEIFDDEGRYLMAFSGYGVDRGQMILPAGLAIDKDDYIYVVDSWNHRVEIFEYLGDKHKARLAAGITSYPPETKASK